jgi:GTP-binding protein
MADIPGIVEGAAEGVGLGIRFLKHLVRTRLLLHIVDVLPVDEKKPEEQAEILIKELAAFSTILSNRPRWLVFNKIDLVDQEQLEKIKNKVIKRLKWKGPVFEISALTKQGTVLLTHKIMEHIDDLAQKALEDEEFALAQQNELIKLEEEARLKVQALKAEYLERRHAQSEDDEPFDDDDYDIEMIYQD